MARHALRIQWFGNTWLTKHYKYNCSNVRCSPNVTYTMFWGQWFEGPRLTKRNVYNGLGTHGSPILTNTLIWWPIAHQALHIQLCGDALLTKPYKYRGGLSGCPCLFVLQVVQATHFSIVLNALNVISYVPGVLGSHGFLVFMVSFALFVSTLVALTNDVVLTNAKGVSHREEG